jgi:biopolymer transport protein ExbD
MAFGNLGSNERNPTLSEINMVPLIDVVLVLLVLFILAAPMAAQSVKVTLPTTKTLPAPKNITAIDIALHADGHITDLFGIAFDIDKQLGTTSGAEFAAEEQTIQIWSDQDVRYEHLANLMVNLRRLGFRKISLMTRSQ